MERTKHLPSELLLGTLDFATAALTPFSHGNDKEEFEMQLEEDAQPVTLLGSTAHSVGLNLQALKICMTQTMQGGTKRRAALHSGLDIPDSLRNFWYPVEFSSKLRQGKPKAFSMFKEHWQLIRDAEGVASCRLDLSEQW